ncbi:hypothetical protein ACP4OV_018275 [Aristida adscensionis]
MQLIYPRSRSRHQHRSIDPCAAPRRSMANTDHDDDEEAFFRGATGAGDDAQITQTPQWGPWEKGVLIGQLLLAAVVGVALVAAATVCSLADQAREATAFHMELAGVEGLDAAAAAMSPAFGLRVRAENAHRGLLWPRCYDGGEVVVSYSGVALAWGGVPRFCVERRRAPAELTVVPWGRGVGLSEDLRRRLDSERRAGGAKITVDMKVFDHGHVARSSPYHHGPFVRSFQFVLRGNEQKINK